MLTDPTAPRVAAPRVTKPRRRSTSRWFPARVLPVLLGVGGAIALAMGPAVEARSEGVEDGNEVLSAALTREALALLAESGPGGDTEEVAGSALDAAAILMDLSAELTPGASEMQWLRADLAQRRGDRATLREALGAYLQQRPDDDAALLKAALVRVAEAQTLDGRLERMQQILRSTERGGAKTEPMRSRLAMLASEAAAELGDPAQALALLATAAKLDPANAEAAAGVYRRVAEATNDRKRLGAAAANWVFAAPVDPTPRLLLARVLAAEGAVGVAAEQYDRAAVFSGNALLPSRDYASWATCLVAGGRTAEAVALLNAAADRLLAETPGSARDSGLLEIDLLRVLLAEPGAEGRALERVLSSLEEAVARGGPEQRLNARLDRAWILAALAIRPVEEAEQALEQAGGRFADADPRRELAAGFIAARRSETTEAMKAFEASGSLPMARFGRASVLGDGDPERLRLLGSVASSPEDPFAGMLAVQTLDGLNREVQPTPVGSAVLDVLALRPPSLWRMQVTREPLVSLRIEADPRSLRPFLPARLNITVRNQSALPVALGSDQTLRPVAFASIALFEDETPLGSLPTQVFNVGRRLTLNPGESFTVPARLDHGPIGQRQSRDPDTSFRFGISVTLDPRLAPDGAVAIGPLGAVATIRNVPALGQPVSEEGVRAWLDDMSGESTIDEYTALIRLATLQGGGQQENPIGPRLAADVNDLLAERAPQLGSTPLALCGLYLRAGNRLGPAGAQLLAAARSSRVDLVRVSTLLGQVRDPTDPAIDSAIRAGSPRLRAFAEAYSEVLSARDPEAQRTFDSLRVIPEEPSGSGEQTPG